MFFCDFSIGKPFLFPGHISKAKGFGVGLKAMKEVTPDELADAINQCTVVIAWEVDDGDRFF